MNLLTQLRSLFEPAVTALAPDKAKVPDLLGAIKPAANADHGDYQANCAMAMANRAAGQQPQDVAKAIVAALPANDVLEPPTVAEKGFINLRLTSDFLSRSVRVLATDPKLGVVPVAKPRTFVIDLSGPNVAKPLHVGHLRSTIIGDSLVRILRFLGHTVIGDNHLGDWGTQFGMILWGWKHCRDDAAFAADPTAELGRLYRLVRRVADAKPEELAADPAAAVLAARFPDAGREVLAETARLHEGDAENRGLWERFMPVCLAEIERLYRRLDVSFDHQLGESFFQPLLAGVVAELLARGLARESRGAVGVFLDGDDAPPFLVRKADGAFLYATTDLATIRWRVEHWRPDRILYVVDHRQGQHFAQLFETARRWGVTGVRFAHVAFGTVLGDDGRPFKTRAGDTVGLEALLDEGVARAFDVVTQADAERGTGIPEAERRRIAEAVGIGAIKYADLSQNRTTDYGFSFDKMLELKGNTAAYMQYAVARVEGIFAKGGVDRATLRRECHDVPLADPRERALALELVRFGEALEDVEADDRPNVLTAYLFDVAAAYSTFYDALPVLKATGAERAARLALCDLTGRVLRHGLELLGIRVPERM